MKLEKRLTYGLYIFLVLNIIYNFIFNNGDKLYRILLVFLSVIILQLAFKFTLLRTYRKLYIPILVFIFFATYLARVLNFYRFDSYDKFLHFSSGILIGYIGLVIYDSFFYEKENIKGRIIFAIIFSIALAGVWEIWEFTCDFLFNMNLQKSVEDTMLDIICGAVGGILASLIGSKLMKIDQKI